VFFQQQGLQADLDPFGLVGAGGDVRTLAAFVVDRGDAAVFRLGDVDLGDDAECGGGQRDGAGGEAGFGVGDGVG